jgi:hypothetical protein
VILHPLPYPDSDRIVVVGRSGGGIVFRSQSSRIGSKTTLGLRI